MVPSLALARSLTIVQFRRTVLVRVVTQRMI